MGYLVAYVALFGIMAVVFGLATVLDLRLIVVGIALNVIDVMVGSWATQALGATPVSAAAEHRHLLGDTIACFVCIVLGYFFFVRAIHAMARRHSVLNAEVTLAKRIHEALVPVVRKHNTICLSCGMGRGLSVAHDHNMGGMTSTGKYPRGPLTVFAPAPTAASIRAPAPAIDAEALTELSAE